MKRLSTGYQRKQKFGEIVTIVHTYGYKLQWQSILPAKIFEYNAYFRYYTLNIPIISASTNN